MAHEVPPLDALAQGALAQGTRIPAGRAPMDLALDAAREAARLGEVPVGAVVTDAAGLVLSVAGNRMCASRDAAAHAELTAMRKAAQLTRHGRLENCTLWVTLEPCPMCAAGAGLYRMRRICFGAYDPKGGGIDHGPRVFQTMPHGFRPEIIGGIQERESTTLLQTFFRMLRDGDS